MKFSGLILFFAIFIQAIPSWAQGDSVFIDGKEWLQPVDFVGYTLDQVNAVCPGGACSGRLPGSTFDLTGYTWASMREVSDLFNAYGVNPPFTAPFQDRTNENASAAMSLDFVRTAFYVRAFIDFGFPVVMGIVRDPTPTGIPPYTPSAFVGPCDFNCFSNATFFPGVYVNEFPIGARTQPQPPEDFFGVWFFRQVEDPPQISEEDFIVVLEEPTRWETHSGIGNLRGWAISEDGIDRVEIYIDGEYAFDAPYGGGRLDVAAKYPEFPESDRSGFSLAFGYSNLDIGEHTVTARAVTPRGQSKESTSTFQVAALRTDFIRKWDIVDLSMVNIPKSTRRAGEIILRHVWIDGKRYNVGLKWRSAEQGFEIIRFRETPP